MTIAHLQDSTPTASSNGIQDGLEAQEGGIATRIEKSIAFAKTHATKAPRAKKAEENTQAQDKTQEQQSRQNTETAENQVDATELAAAVELKGARERDHESLENNERYFHALTTTNRDYLFQQVDSIVRSIIDKAHPKSLIDSAFGDESLEKRAFLKVVMLEIAMANPEQYGIEIHQLEKLEDERSALYERYKEYIENTKLAIDIGQATVGTIRFSVKHAIQMFHLLPDKNEELDLSFGNFLRKIIANTNRDVYLVLGNIYKKWSVLARCDRRQYKQDVLQYRQYVLQRKLGQVKMAITLLKGIDQIAALCQSNEKGEDLN